MLKFKLHIITQLKLDIGHKLESEFAALHLPSEISVLQFYIKVIVQFVQKTIKNLKIAKYSSDMEFVKNFTPPDFQAKNFTPSISPSFNSFSDKKHKDE